jgi:DNA-binding CsgD family transcriptional regulator
VLCRLLPQFARTVVIRRHLLDSSSRGHAALVALDRLAIGVVLLGADGDVQHLNRAADAVVAENDGLWVARGRLRAASAAESRALLQRVHGAIATANGNGVGAGGAIRLSRPSQKRALVAVVTPLRRPSSAAHGGPVAAVFVTDPERRRRPCTTLLREVYGLTPAEARVAACLADGRSLREMADSFEVTLETVRSQLKRVFDKTGTRRQAGLVSVLADALLQLTETP